MREEMASLVYAATGTLFDATGIAGRVMRFSGAFVSPRASVGMNVATEQQAPIARSRSSDEEAETRSDEAIEEVLDERATVDERDASCVRPMECGGGGLGDGVSNVCAADGGPI